MNKMPASIEHQKRMLAHLEEQERIARALARAGEQVDRILGPDRLREWLEAIDRRDQRQSRRVININSGE